ncbi:MAG TPA: hypothetical protein VL172_05140 [Kofleriaceae bacterium]|nr:hypothetical protein [Kofleriaceae bacterium]
MRALIALLALAGCHEDLLADLPDAAAPPADACVPAGSHIVYLNREPTTFTPGSPDDSVANVTSLVSAEVTTQGVSTLQLTDTRWRTITECVAALLAAYDVRVTNEDPGDVDHWELVVTHDGTEVGQPASSAGVAPAGCPSAGPREIAFAFWQPFNLGMDAQGMCELLGWEIGIMAGLSPTVDCRDVLGPLDGSAPECADPATFLDETVGCADAADYQPADCRCGGTLQNSDLTLTAYFGVNACAGAGSGSGP